MLYRSIYFIVIIYNLVSNVHLRVQEMHKVLYVLQQIEMSDINSDLQLSSKVHFCSALYLAVINFLQSLSTPLCKETFL